MDDDEGPGVSASSVLHYPHEMLLSRYTASAEAHGAREMTAVISRIVVDERYSGQQIRQQPTDVIIHPSRPLGEANRKVGGKDAW